ncbi:MAG: HD domain-containing protein [Anaerolineaceae bacterium]|nr:HD domain-containing protein [Anaerolineaceae bacterium]
MDQTTDLLTSEMFAIVQEKLQGMNNVYLVGGAIRDVLMMRPIHDMDFVVIGSAANVAKKLADELQGGFYMLDEERDIARVVIKQTQGKKFYLDFSTLREENLFKDLTSRDFTINAMAVNVSQPGLLIDPLKGVKDIKAGYLQVCNPNSFSTDPIRVIRAVRMAIQFNLKITENTLYALKEQVENLHQISKERIRDELFRMLESEKIASAIRLLDELDILKTVWPELADMKQVDQGKSHSHDVWEHTLGTINALENLWDMLVGEFDEEKASNLLLGTASARLGRYRGKLVDHFQQNINPSRSRKSLIFYTALYHDIGKPAAKVISENGEISFRGHDETAISMMREAARKIRLSENEVNAVTTMVKHHMQLHVLSLDSKVPSKREIHQFFKQNRSYGIDLCLLMLADLIGKYQHEMNQDLWFEKVNLVRLFMEAYFDQFDEIINPPKLITGSELMKQFRIEAGPQVGELLEELQAAQAEGLVTSKKDATKYIKKILKK